MKKLISIGSLFVLGMFFSSSAMSQTMNSTTQTVMFSVSRSVRPEVKTLANLQSMNLSSTSSELAALQNQLKQHSSKVTVSALTSSSSNNHLDLLSVLEIKKSVANEKTPVVLTVTE